MLAEGNEKLHKDQEALKQKDKSLQLQNDALMQQHKQQHKHNLLIQAEQISQREALEKLTERQSQAEKDRRATLDETLRLASVMEHMLEDSQLAQAASRSQCVTPHQVGQASHVQTRMLACVRSVLLACPPMGLALPHHATPLLVSCGLGVNLFLCVACTQHQLPKDTHNFLLCSLCVVCRADKVASLTLTLPVCLGI